MQKTIVLASGFLLFCHILSGTPIPANNPETPYASRNLLPGDTGFETGVGGWMNRVKSPLTNCTSTGRDSTACLPLRLDTAAGDVAVMSMWNGGLCTPGSEYTVSFYAKTDRPEQEFLAAVRTLGGRWVKGISCRPTAEWKRYFFTFRCEDEDPCYLQFTPGRSGKTDAFVDDVQLEKGAVPTPYMASERLSLYSTIGSPAEVVTADGTVPVLTVRIRNNQLPPGTLPLKMETSLPNGTQRTEEFSLAPEEMRTFRYECPAAKTPGYYPVRIRVTVPGSAIIVERESPFAVVPVFEHKETAGFFGIQDCALPRTVLPRIGSSWLRIDPPKWLAAEPEENKIQPLIPLENWHVPGMFAECTVGEITRVPQWAQVPGSLLARPEAIRNYFEQTLISAGKLPGVFELQNEPDLNIPRMKGVDREESIRYFAALLKKVAPVVHRHGRQLQFNASGDAQWFAAGVFEQAADSFDIYAPHPYVYPRDIYPDRRSCVEPERPMFRKNLANATDLIHRYGGRHRLSVGELGWAVSPAVDLDSPETERLAAFIPRTFLLVRALYPQFEKLTWYTSMDRTWNVPTYGLWQNRNGYRPLPGVAAYAWAAKQIDGGDGFQLLNDGETMLVRWNNSGKTRFAIWNVDFNTTSLKLRLPWTAVTNQYGTVLDNSGFEAGEKPVYIECTPTDAERTARTLLEAIAVQRPLQIDCSLADETTMRVALTNNLKIPWTGTMRLNEQTKNISLPVSGRNVFLMHGVASSAGKLVFESGTGNILEYSFQLPAALPIKRFAGEGWETFNFSDTAQIVLDSREWVYPPDTIAWQGPDDCSARIFLGWNEKYFFLMAKVRDDGHRLGEKEIWEGDSIQIGFDTRNDATQNGGRDDNDYEYGTNTSGDVYCWFGQNRQRVNRTILRRIDRNEAGHITSYRLAIPWNDLDPASGKAGTVMGISIAIHDRDGKNCNYYLGYGQGIVHGKNPFLYRKIKLER